MPKRSEKTTTNIVLFEIFIIFVINSKTKINYFTLITNKILLEQPLSGRLSR